MKLTNIVRLVVTCVTVFLLSACEQEALTPESDAAAIAMDADDIAGVVRSAGGVEAGVWVIAETDELPTKFVKIVVTDDDGRYLLPDLPEARYSVWVRGYGLVDSPPVRGTPGQELALTAVLAPSPEDAARVYPANYWYSLIEVPPESEFPGTGPSGNGILPRSRAQWISGLKQGCQNCHQMGTRITREIDQRDRFDSTPLHPGSD